MNSCPRNDPAATPTSRSPSNQLIGAAAWGQLKARGKPDSTAVLRWKYRATTMAGSDLPIYLQTGSERQGSASEQCT